jgi:Uma2 family endonuclease
MSVAPSTNEIEYPESDGKPVGETDAHIDWTFRIRDILRHRFAGQRVYVGSDMLVYFQEGKPSRFFVPDEFVVLDCEQRDRRTFKIWDEGRTPNVIFELTSRSTKTEDECFKPQIFEQIGVGEYFLYDPIAEYLKPALQGFRLSDDGYIQIEAGANGWLLSDQLGIEMGLDGISLVMRDAATQQVLMTPAEAARVALEAEQAAREAEQAAREAAEAKLVELQSEVQRLRDELKKHDP